MHSFFPIPMYATSVAAALFGVWVFWKRPRERLNQLFFAVSVSVAWWAFGFGQVYRMQDAASALYWSRFGICGATLIPTFFYHFMLCFLRRDKSRMLPILYVGSFFFLGLSRSSIFLTTPARYFWGYYPRGGSVNIFFIIFFYTGFALALKEIHKTYQELKKHPKPYISLDQIKYVFRAYCVATCSISDYFANYGIAVYPFAYLAAIGWLVTMAYAVLRYKLMDLRLILRKTLIYSIVSAVVTVIYFFSASVMAGFSSAHFGGHSLMASALISGFITVTFLPLFRRIQYFIDHLFFRFKIDREARLMEFSSEIIQVDNLDSMTRSLYHVVEEALHPKSMALYLRLADKSDYVEVAHALSPHLPPTLPAGNVWENYFRKEATALVLGEEDLRSDIREAMERSGLHAAVPLISRQDILGFLLLGEKRSEEAYSNEDLMLLRIVLNQATIAYEKPKLIKEVTSGFAHEIKMPLANIALPAELTCTEVRQALQGKLAADEVLPKIQRRMKYIMDQVFLAGHRVDALQAMTGQDRSSFRRIRLEPLINQSIKAMDELSAAKNCLVAWREEEVLPEIYGDARQLAIALENILKNGIEAAGSPGIVEIRTSVTSTEVCIQVRDNGPGVFPEHELLLFNPHFTTKGSHGRGMGLTLSRQIARQHGGELTFLKLTSGACFQFNFPR